MIKVKDGYAKLIGTTYSGSVSRVLLSNGGDHILGNSNDNIPLNNGTVNTNLNADMLDGLHIHAGRNNEVNKIVRTDANGFLQTGWINTTSGNIGTDAINKIYCSNDDYIRYKTPANFFPTLANRGNNISITVAGQNRTLTVGYASNADTIDGYHANKIYNASSFIVNNNNTSNTYILLATITIGGTSLNSAEFTVLFQNRECLDSSSFILSGAIRRSSTTNVTATLSYITLHTETPRNIYLRSDDGVTFMVYIQSATGIWTTYYRAIPIVDSENIIYSNIGTTSPISGSVLNITATKGGNVNYASSASDAEHIVSNSTSKAKSLTYYIASKVSETLADGNSWCKPAGVGSNGNSMILRMSWYNPTYGHDIFASPNTQTLWHRSTSNNTNTWREFLDSINYTTYTVKKDGTGASGTWGISITGNAATASKATTADTAGALYSVAKTDPGSACSDGQNVKWFNNIAKPSDQAYAGTNAGFPVTNNANGILWLGTHSGPHGWQIGFSSNSRIYARYINNNTFPTTANGGSWNKIAWTSDIPTVTNYWWANVKISNASNTDTQPTFGFATIKNRLSISSSTLTKTNPTHQQLVINGPHLDSSVTPRLADYPGIGFHMPSKGWGSLIYNGNITAINQSYDGYINYFGEGFRKNGSDNTYVLLGGGGHKLISDFATASHTHKYAGSDSSGGAAYSANKLNSRGKLTAYEEGSTTMGESGVNFYTVGLNGYPVMYGNLLHIYGKGASQLLAEWCGNSNLGHLYYRSKRDNSDNGWTAWGKVAFVTDNVASATKWATARTLTLTGSVTGSVSIDGSGDVTLATTTNHTHSYLPLAGGTMTGQIQSAGKSSSWIKGRDNAMIRVNSKNNYSVLSSIKTTNGSWEIGHFDASGYYNNLLFGYYTDDAYSANNNNRQIKITFTSDGQVKATQFNGALNGNAVTASKWVTARTLTLTGSITGSVSFDGSGNVSLATTTNHTHTWANIENKPSTFTPSSHTHTISNITNLQAILDGKAAVSHTHDYLPLSGGTMTGQIIGNNKGGHWILGRSNAAIYQSRNTVGDWHPVIGFKTKTGSWEFGSVGNDFATFSWGSDSDYNSGNNITTQVNLRVISGTIALTSEIPTKASWNYDDVYSKLGHTHDDRYYTESEINSKLGAYLPLSGGTMTGNITYTGIGTSYIGNGENDAANEVGGALNNLVIASWQGVSFTTSCAGQTYTNKNAVSINCRNGYVYANTFIGSFRGNASSATKLTSSAGSATLPIYFSDGKPVACNKASIFSNLSNNGNDISITIAGQTRTLTVGYAQEANWASEAYSAEEASIADTVDGYHASDLVKFYLSPMASNASADSAKSWFINTMPSGSGAIVYNVPGTEKTIIVGKSTGSYGHMLQLNYDDNYLRILRYSSGSWKTTDWEKISAGYADSAESAITASKWTTARTLTIGNTSKAVDGSTNVSWTLEEIGMTTSEHTHTLKLESTTEASSITLAHGDKYKLTAGGSSVIFTLPTDNNTAHTKFAWTNGSTAGPTGSLSGNHTAVSFPAIPSATASISGIVTTETQSFAGNKTFNGHITLGDSYQLKRAGSASSWYNGRDKAIVRQTSTASGYSVIISSKTTNGSWEIGNESNDLMFTYITDSNYNSKNNDFLGLLYITSEGEVHSNNNIYATHFFENSDIRYKKILKNLSINSNIIANLPLFDFEWIENNAIGTGTSAQAVQQILPNLVSGTDKLTLDYGVLGTIAGITACKELVTQKSELQQLKEKVKQLEDKLRKYENT